MTSLLVSLFSPGAQWDFEPDWQARESQAQTYRFDTILFADRKCGHRGPLSKGKPMEDAFALDVPSTWMSDLKNRVLANYKGNVSLQPPRKPVVTYLSRQQATFRRLTQESHDSLIHELRRLEKEGLIEFNLEDFGDGDSKEDQVAKMSRTTVSTFDFGKFLFRTTR